jgi:hypothetical protein
VKLTTHLHLVLRSKYEWSCKSILQYAFMAWCSVKAQGQLYLYPLPGIARVPDTWKYKSGVLPLCQGRESGPFIRTTPPNVMTRKEFLGNSLGSRGVRCSQCDRSACCVTVQALNSLMLCVTCHCSRGLSQGRLPASHRGWL